VYGNHPDRNQEDEVNKTSCDVQGKAKNPADDENDTDDGEHSFLGGRKLCHVFVPRLVAGPVSFLFGRHLRHLTLSDLPS
jgi:hypothetical protein